MRYRRVQYGLVVAKSILTDEELDVYYFLIHRFIEKEGFDKLFPLLDRAKEKNVTAEETVIKQYIKELNAKKSLS